MIVVILFTRFAFAGQTSECGPAFVQELQDQFLCTNSVKLGGCVPLTNEVSGGVVAPQPSRAIGSKAALDKLKDVQRRKKELEDRLRALNEQHTLLQEQLVQSSAKNAGPRTGQVLAQARLKVVYIKLAIDDNRTRAMKTTKDLADLLYEFGQVDGAKEKPFEEYSSELISLDSAAAQLMVKKQLLLLERGSSKDLKVINDKLEELRSERAAHFRTISAPATGGKIKRRNQQRMAVGIAGSYIGAGLGKMVQNVMCAKEMKAANPEIFKYADIDNNCKFWINDDQFEKFVSLFQAEQLDALKKIPALCQAYQEHLARLRTPKVVMKGDPRCLADGGTRYEATVEVNGRTYNHVFEMDDGGGVRVRGSFDPGGKPDEGSIARQRTFEIRFDNQMRGANIVTKNFDFGIVPGYLATVGTFKREYFIYKSTSAPPTSDEIKTGSKADFMDRQLVVSLGEQIEAIQTYAPALLKICSERKQTAGTGPHAQAKEAELTATSGVR